MPTLRSELRISSNTNGRVDGAYVRCVIVEAEVVVYYRVVGVVRFEEVL